MVEGVKKFLNKEIAILVGIFLLAYILRIFPYLLGYNLPFTDDGMKDFDQVLYIIENGRINFFDHPFYFGSFPVLHLLTFFVSQFDLDPLKVFLFIPQIFPSLGLVFFYFFLKKYFPVKHSLFAVFLIAIFGIHIHWSAQPVRETLGLFFFPLLIYLFDKIVNGFNDNKNYLFLILFFLSSGLMVFSHHWSSLMVFLTLLTYLFAFINNKKSLYYGLLLLVTFLGSAFAYWFFVFEIAFERLQDLLSDPGSILIIVISLLLFFGLYRHKSKILLLKTKKVSYAYFIFITLFVLLFFINFIPAHYPIQIWLPIFIYLLFLGVGIFYTKNNYLDYFLLLNVPFALFFLIGIFSFIEGTSIYKMTFDPFRVIEFAIFPSSIIIAYGFFVFKKYFENVFLPVVLILVFLASLVYPSIFTYGNNFENTIFYDIRSDVRYVSSSSQKLIDWAHKNNHSVYSPRPEVKMYQRVFHHPQEKSLLLVSKNDISLKKNFDLINDPIIKVEYLLDWKYKIDYEAVLVKQGRDYLVVPKIYFDLRKFEVNNADLEVLELLNYFNEEVNIIGQINLKDLENEEFLIFDAQFISQNIPITSVVKGDVIVGTFVFKNVSNFIWEKDSGIKLKDHLGFYFIDLPYDVSPGEEVVFNYTEITSEVFDSYDLKTRMHAQDFGYFGEQSPEVVIIYEK